MPEDAPTDDVPSADEQALLSKALASIASAVFITDTHGNIIRCNGAFSRLCGYPRQEIRGKKPNFLRSGQQDTQFYVRLWQTIYQGRPWQGEVVDRRRDGTLYTVLEIITPL